MGVLSTRVLPTHNLVVIVFLLLVHVVQAPGVLGSVEEGSYAVLDLLPSFLTHHTPEIIDASLHPDRVKVNDILTIEAEVHDTYGIREVTAEIEGIETVSLELINGTPQHGLWQVQWLVHSTVTREYKVVVRARNFLNLSDQTTLSFYDPPNMIVFFNNTDASIPTGWTCISCTSSDPFFARYPLGNSSYGGTGCADTHNHTASASAPSSTASTINAYDLTATTSVAADLHVHELNQSGVINATNIPSTYTLQMIEFNAGIPEELPAQAIIILKTTTIPSGFTLFNASDNRTLRGNDSFGNTYGVDTHTHSFVINSTNGSLTVSTLRSGTAASSPPLHTHSSGVETTNTLSHVSPFISVVLVQVNSNNTRLPDGMIALFNATPGGNWVVQSDFYNRTMLGNSSGYRGTGGVESHTPDNQTVTLPAGNTVANIDSAPNEEGAETDHTHTIGINFSTGTNIPEYTSVIVANLTDRTAPTGANTSVNVSITDPSTNICVNATAHDTETGVSGVHVQIVFPDGTVENISMSQNGGVPCAGTATDDWWGVV